VEARVTFLTGIFVWHIIAASGMAQVFFAQLLWWSSGHFGDPVKARSFSEVTLVTQATRVLSARPLW
jgi:hypothetical protein